MAVSEVLGLALVVLGVQFSVLANTFVKLLASVPMLQLMQARFLLQWLCSVSCCLVLRLRGHPIHMLGQPGRRLLLVGRAVTFSGALGMLWCALRTLPVGEATAITYLNPVVCGFLATYLLGEKLGWRFSAQAAVSCVGVLLVVDPFAPEGAHGGDDGRGVALALAGCVSFATGNCLVRVLKGVHPLEVQVFQDMLTALVFMPVAQLACGTDSSWAAWGQQEVLLLLAFTVCGLAASFCVILGYTFAPASKAALFMYVEVPSAFMMQVCFFGRVSNPIRLLGAGLIVVAAACRLVYEVRSARLPVQAAQEPLEDDNISAASPVLMFSEVLPMVRMVSRNSQSSPMPTPFSLPTPGSPFPSPEPLKRPLLQACEGTSDLSTGSSSEGEAEASGDGDSESQAHVV